MTLDTRFNLQFITHYTPDLGYLDGALLALRGGCRWVQLRMKDATPDEILAVGRPLREACRQQGAVFLLDDHVELVEALDADGVHLGKDDMPVREARQLLGPARIIGGTANTWADVERHWQGGADYVGCGPFRFTATKARLAPTLGLDGYRSLLHHMQDAGCALPVVAIGGITPADIPDILATGVRGIAMSGAILSSPDPVAMTRQLSALMTR